MSNDRIPRLVDRYQELATGQRNRSLLAENWRDPGLAYMGDIGIPRPGKVPIIAVPHLSMWARKMGISVATLFTDPAAYLEVFLSRETGRFEHIQDDRPLDGKVFLALGAGFESTLFGAEQQYSDTEDPWVDRTPVLANPEEYEKLGLPDFYESGLMALAHRFYDEISELLTGSGLEVVFPEWVRSPFGIAVHLRGLEGLLIDMLEKPDLFTRLLDVINRSAIHYQAERNAFLTGTRGAPYRPTFHNDEVNVPSISPQHYRDMILPHERAYAEAFGGLSYWHSCGDVTAMIRDIREIRNIAIFHVGPCTDLAEAAEIFGDVTLDVCLDSMEIYRGRENEMKLKVRNIVETCRQRGARSLSIRPGILQGFGSIAEDLDAVSRWVTASRDTLDELGF